MIRTLVASGLLLGQLGAVPSTVVAQAPGWERPAAGEIFVVLLAGYGGAPWPFGPLQSALVARGWRAEQLLAFSYAGGEVVGGDWHAAPYGCAATGAPLAASVAALDRMLREHGAAYPNAGYVLVGHSLGGLVGWTYLQSQLAGGASNISGVVTIDAPLRGSSWEKRLAVGLSGCGGAVFEDIARLYAEAPRLGQTWRDQATGARGRGVPVTTIGSDGDCLYAPGLPGCQVAYSVIFNTPDDRETQYIDGAAVRLPVPVDPAWPVARPFGRVASAHLAALTVPIYVARVADEVALAAGGKPD